MSGGVDPPVARWPCLEVRRGANPTAVHPVARAPTSLPRQPDRRGSAPARGGVRPRSARGPWPPVTAPGGHLHAASVTTSPAHRTPAGEPGSTGTARSRGPWTPGARPILPGGAERPVRSRSPVPGLAGAALRRSRAAPSTSRSREPRGTGRYSPWRRRPPSRGCVQHVQPVYPDPRNRTVLGVRNGGQNRGPRPPAGPADRSGAVRIWGPSWRPVSHTLRPPRRRYGVGAR